VQLDSRVGRAPPENCPGSPAGKPLAPAPLGAGPGQAGFVAVLCVCVVFPYAACCVAFPPAPSSKGIRTASDSAGQHAFAMAWEMALAIGKLRVLTAAENLRKLKLESKLG
jgi:hypothetical protein